MAAETHEVDEVVLSIRLISRCQPNGRRRNHQVTYKGLGDGVTFLTEPLAMDTEITGPIAAKLWVVRLVDGGR